MMLGKAENLALLHEQFQNAFTENPLRFFYKFVMPLLPRDVKLEFADEFSEAAARLCDEISTALEARRNALVNGKGRPPDVQEEVQEEGQGSVRSELSEVRNAEPLGPDEG